MPDLKIPVLNRRGFVALAACASMLPAATDTKFRPLFDGRTLKGWKAMPRVAMPRFPGAPEPNKESEMYKRMAANVGEWTVVDGAIVGGQSPAGSGLGAYLVSEEKFDDFELKLEARPDYPVDTGIMIRTVPEGNVGIQVLLDHRPKGAIAGYYGNGLAGFHAYEYAFAGERNEAGRLVKLTPEKPTEQSARVPLDFMASPEVFLKVWKIDGWNEFRIRSVGALPRVTTWINGEKISELDVAKVSLPAFDPAAALKRIGRSGHIAFEVHNNDPKIGKDRWWPGAVCRWRKISIRRITA
ncbi:MAG: DUF1080 domain-containing protein [Bryobacteraceae bacterium]|nr:DUF1080 domain-containing protein [Bryobacteraceae bacterium]